MNYRRLNRELTTELRKRLRRASLPQVRNQALVTQALAFCPNCHLPILALLLPVPTKRPNLVQRIRRWLANPAVIQGRCYMPLIRPVLAQWSQRELGLVMDRTDIKDRWSILTLAMPFVIGLCRWRGTSCPLGQRVQSSRSLCSGRCNRTCPASTTCASASMRTASFEP